MPPLPTFCETHAAALRAAAASAKRRYWDQPHTHSIWALTARAVELADRRPPPKPDNRYAAYLEIMDGLLK